MSNKQYPYEAGRRDVDMTNIWACAFSDADFNQFNYIVCYVMNCFKGGIFVPALWVGFRLLWACGHVGAPTKILP